jgi:hypothetical protein
MSQGPLDYAPPLSRTEVLTARASRCFRRLLPYLAVVLSCYVVSYACLSSFGRFQPAVIGAGQNGNSVKWYRWSPAGFHRGFHQRWALYYIYLPLYLADRAYWHRDDDALIKKYPTTTPSTRAEWTEWMH